MGARFDNEILWDFDGSLTLSNVLFFRPFYRFFWGEGGELAIFVPDSCASVDVAAAAASSRGDAAAAAAVVAVAAAAGPPAAPLHSYALRRSAVAVLRCGRSRKLGAGGHSCRAGEEEGGTGGLEARLGQGGGNRSPE